MSSPYPPFGGIPMQPCARCGRPFSPNEPRCSNCGYYNPPAQGNSNAPFDTPSPTAPWGEGSQQSAYAQGQMLAPQRGQLPPIAAQNNGISQRPVPQSVPPDGAPYGGTGAFAEGGGTYATSGQLGNAAPQQGRYPAQFSSASSQAAPSMTSEALPESMEVPQSEVTASRSRRPGFLRIAIIIVILAIVVGTGVVGYGLLGKHNVALSGSPGSVFSNLTKPSLFTDAFNDNANGWNLQGVPGKAVVSVANGTLTLTDNDHKLLWEVVPGGKTFNNFKLMVDAILSKGDEANGYGIFIRGALNDTGELVTYYRFTLYGDGTYAIFKGIVDANASQGTAKLVDYTTSPVIQKRGQVNHLIILANGPSMSFIVNGQTLSTISDNSYTSGSVSLFVSNLPETQLGAQAKFSNLNLYPADA